jgi:hypothetical protein
MIRKSFVVIATLVLLGLLALGVRSWLEAHDDFAKMQATIAGQQQLIAAADAREHDRAASLQQTLGQIADLKRRVQTPAQILSSLPQYLPLPQPIEIAPPPTPAYEQASTTTQPLAAALAQLDPQGTHSNRQGTAVPEKSASALPEKPMAQIPLEDLKPLYDFAQDCRSCQAQLSASQADLRDERTKSAALATERDAAVKAAKGGGFWSRLKRDAKWLAIGVGIGVALTHR